jgi:integrase
VIPTLGGVELQQLTPAHLAGLYQELLASGRRHRPGGLAPKTVRNVHVLMHRALRDAVRWGYTVRNVADAADPPKAKPAELQVWTPGQLRTFLLHVRQDRNYAAWLLAATTGMRRGELLGLRWIDVDLAAGRVAAGSLASWSTTLFTLRSPRRPGADGLLPWTPRRWLPFGSTRPARPPSGW